MAIVRSLSIQLVSISLLCSWGKLFFGPFEHALQVYGIAFWYKLSEGGRKVLPPPPGYTMGLTTLQGF